MFTCHSNLEQVTRSTRISALGRRHNNVIPHLHSDIIITIIMELCQRKKGEFHPFDLSCARIEQNPPLSVPLDFFDVSEDNHCCDIRYHLKKIAFVRRSSNCSGKQNFHTKDNAEEETEELSQQRKSKRLPLTKNHNSQC